MRRPESTGDMIASLRDVSVRHRVRRHSGSLRSILGAMQEVGGKVTMRGGALHVDSLSIPSLDIARGSRVGLIGVNGSGKTTLLNVLGGLLPPTTGKVTTRGQVVPIINIHSGFHPLLTGRENVEVKLLYLNLGRAERQAAIAEVMEFTGLGSYFDMPMKGYSAGMRVRLALGAATVVKPDLLIMDEWINAGDAAFRAKSQARLESIVEKSGGMVIASHAYPVLEEWCDRLLWMHEGHIVEDGPLAPVWKAYRQHQLEHPGQLPAVHDAAQS
ncbi:ABC transporter ATP-binding protein [Arvimicrobium flavum]|uniref:ABC transporter ATP-binding protein n=1 Tax=Arvimicrobium flavum TaxID=3393320 RepID=UPI00237A09A5|nr:ABC transporter ATP-binding protein [Mesorhizobium shangrilense]